MKFFLSSSGYHHFIGHYCKLELAYDRHVLI